MNRRSGVIPCTCAKAEFGPLCLFPQTPEALTQLNKVALALSRMGRPLRWRRNGQWGQK